MKVRSSVKLICEGCKVSASQGSCLYYLFDESSP